MTKDEARKQAYQIWVKWPDRRVKSNALGLRFYTHLQEEHSHLLSFRCSGDRYQVVNSWVTSWQQEDKITGR